MAPILVHNASCDECGLDGWNETPRPIPKLHIAPSNLMECSICFKIVHPICIGPKANPQVIAIVNDDLPNSWECPLCLDTSRPRPIPKKNRVGEEPLIKIPTYPGSNGALMNNGINHDINLNGTLSADMKGAVALASMQFAINSGPVVKEEKFDIRKVVLEKSVSQWFKIERVRIF